VQKILLIAATALSLAAAALGFLNHDKIAGAKVETSKLQSEISSKIKENSKLSADLKSANEKVTIATSDAEKNAAELTDLKDQVSKSTGTLADSQKLLAEKDSTIAQQKTELAAKISRITELEGKSVGGKQNGSDPSAELKKQLEEKDLLTASLQSKLKDQAAQLTSLKEREAQRKSKTMRIGLEGRILAVNPSWNFVVLSLGDRNGVVNNAEMLIKRGSQLIGKVRISSVEPSTSVADIVANSVRPGMTVQPGDSVIYGGPMDESEVKIP
jgi:hypothetical protein